MRSKKLPHSDIKSAFGKLSTPQMRYSSIFGEWKAAGYPEDVDSLTHMLQRLGYSRRQILSALEQTEVADTGSEDIDQIIKRLHNYIVTNGLEEQIIEQMASEFGFGKTEPQPTSRFGRFKRLFKKLSEEELHGNVDYDTDPSYNNDDTLTEEQYLHLLQELDKRLINRLNASRIKRKIVKAWKRGMHKRTHYDDMLKHVNLSLSRIFE